MLGIGGGDVPNFYLIPFKLKPYPSQGSYVNDVIPRLSCLIDTFY